MSDYEDRLDEIEQWQAAGHIHDPEDIAWLLSEVRRMRSDLGAIKEAVDGAVRENNALNGYVSYPAKVRASTLMQILRGES